MHVTTMYKLVCEYSGSVSLCSDACYENGEAHVYNVIDGGPSYEVVMKFNGDKATEEVTLNPCPAYHPVATQSVIGREGLGEEITLNQCPAYVVKMSSDIIAVN